MEAVVLRPRRIDFEPGEGCAYLIDEAAGRRTCGSQRIPSSAYCPQHHALCYISSGSRDEVRWLREFETLASAVGGRRSRPSTGPTRQFLDRLEQAVRASS